MAGKDRDGTACGVPGPSTTEPLPVLVLEPGQAAVAPLGRLLFRKVAAV
jgi:hypothetical protein